MTPRQSRFVQEYLVDLNATQAAIRAGYSEKTAASIGFENLRKPEIASEIEQRQDKRSEKLELTQDWVIGKLIENLDRSMEKDGYQGSVANGALQLIGKHLGMFGEKSDVTVRDGGLISPEQRETRVLQLLTTAKQRKTA